MSRRLPMIDVPRPCPESWDSMQGIGPARDCAVCGRKVHDLSAMTSADVGRLVARSGERVCVRFTRDINGAIVTIDTPPIWQTGRRFRARLSGAVIAAIVSTLRPHPVLASAPAATKLHERGSSGAPAAGDAARDGGAIIGTIKTQINEPLPGAIVVAVNESTGAEFRTETDADGRYRLRVPRGTYTVGVTAEVFEAQGKPHVHVGSRTDTTFDAELRLPVLGVVVAVYNLPADDGKAGVSFLRAVTSPFRALARLIFR
jgi:hypothetical protein